MSEAGYYNPQSNLWNSILQLPEKKEGSAVCTLNNKIYIIGGNNNNNYCKSVWAYCTETKIWESVADLNFPRSHSGITLTSYRVDLDYLCLRLTELIFSKMCVYHKYSHRQCKQYTVCRLNMTNYSN